MRTYSKAKVGNNKLSTNFTVKEFASKDGADAILIDTNLVTVLQAIRNHFKQPVTITSGYRSKEYNASVGGSSSSYHTKGQAADIQVQGVNPVIVGMYAETLGVGGIGLYAYVSGGFVHIDTRSVKYRWLQIVRNTRYQAISRIMPTLRQGGAYNTTYSVELVQRNLGVSQSGTFGDLTNTAVRKFQLAHGLQVDGIVGTNTWRTMFQ